MNEKTGGGVKKNRGIRMMESSSLLALFFLSMAIVSCVSTGAQYKEELPDLPEMNRVTLRPGDEVELKFPYWKELNDTQIIRPDGYINLQLIDAVLVKGLTPEELDAQLTELYESKIKDPDITVVVRSLVDQRIYVGGEVNTPGLLTLQGEVNVLQAIINAGGFNETAKLDQVIVIRKGESGSPVPYQINIHQSLYEANSPGNFLLQPNDVVYVPKTAIANVNKFVKQYIADLLLFRGFGVGFSYELHDAGSNTRTSN
jgi:protein involved in polysaccharide export with SLBB domain